MNGVGKGRQLEARTILKITEENYKDRNINFRKYTKFLMTEMLNNKDFKTLNMEAKTYGIAIKLTIIPVILKEKGKETIIVPEKKLIKVVK